MEELIVVLGALVILALSIAGMNIYRWRTDVLTGPYISNEDRQLAIPDKWARRVRATEEKRSKVRPLPARREFRSNSFGRRATGYSTNWTIDLSRLRTGLQSTLRSGYNLKRLVKLGGLDAVRLAKHNRMSGTTKPPGVY